VLGVKEALAFISKQLNLLKFAVKITGKRLQTRDESSLLCDEKNDFGFPLVSPHYGLKS
jgi:hypothetical protein